MGGLFVTRPIRCRVNVLSRRRESFGLLSGPAVGSFHGLQGVLPSPRLRRRSG